MMVDQRALTPRQRYAWAVMGTFDMLAPQYDQPQTEADVSGAMWSAGIGEIKRTLAAGLILIGRKVTSSVPGRP
jgi:hypothetical protein